MSRENDLSGNLFDYLIDLFNLKNDLGLSKKLGLPPPHISKIRNGKLPIGPTMILAIHEKLDIPVAIIRRLIKEGMK